MKLSIVVPCYNESKDIAKNAEIIKDKLKELNQDYELILVNDGSKDNTKEVIESIKGVKALSYDVNRGKGGAVKYGIENATGDYVLFMDADYDMIIGSRHAKDSVIKKKQPALRVFIGWCCRKLVNMKFVNNFAFDVEYLYIAKLNNLSIYEMGVIWADDRGSTVSPLKSSIKFFKDLSFIKKHKKTYLFDNQVD